MPRQRKNVRRLVGRAGRKAIEEENLRMEERRWARRKITVERRSEGKRE